MFSPPIKIKHKNNKKPPPNNKNSPKPKPKSDTRTHLNRCDFIRGHFSWAPSKGQFPASSGDPSVERPAGTEGKLTDLALSCYGQRLLSSRESRMAGPAHWKSFPQGHGPVHFFAGVGPRASAQQNPRECLSLKASPPTAEAK